MVQSVSGEVRSYLNLKETNQRLTEQLATAELNYLHLKQQVDFAIADTISPFVEISKEALYESPLTFTTAQVISSSTNRRRNLVLLDKGRKDGIKEQMGVVSESGIAGIISLVNEHYSVMVPLLNPTLRLSCTIKKTGYVGTLSWNTPGENFAQLSELFRHADYNKGDTVVTSGYSSVFPPGLFVGTIEESSHLEDNIPNAKSSATVRLGTDFDRLQFVYVITGGQIVSPKAVDSLLNKDR